MRRRRLRQLEENSPYSQSPRASRVRAASSSAVMSELVDTFVEDPIDRWKRGHAKKPQGLTSLSLLSSNLSASLRSFRHFQESNVTMVANPLTAPPPARSKHSSDGRSLMICALCLCLCVLQQDSNADFCTAGTSVVPAPSVFASKKNMENRVSFCNGDVPPSPLSPRKSKEQYVSVREITETHDESADDMYIYNSVQRKR